MEQQEERLKEMEARFSSMVQEIDKTYLRKMQGDMHRCAANCCDNLSYSIERNQNCVQNCCSSLDAAQQFVQSEVNRFQNRWSRCIMECNDKMRDRMGVEKSSPNLSKEFEGCSSKCIDAQSDLIHTISTNIKGALTNQKYNAQM